MPNNKPMSFRRFRELPAVREIINNRYEGETLDQAARMVLKGYRMAAGAGPLDAFKLGVAAGMARSSMWGLTMNDAGAKLRLEHESKGVTPWEVNDAQV